MCLTVTFPSTEDVLRTERRLRDTNHPCPAKKYTWSFLRVKNKLAFCRLTDEAEIRFQNIEML